MALNPTIWLYLNYFLCKKDDPVTSSDSDINWPESTGINGEIMYNFLAQRFLQNVHNTECIIRWIDNALARAKKNINDLFGVYKKCIVQLKNGIYLQGKIHQKFNDFGNRSL